MSRTFCKLFTGILESTVWCEPLATRIVWITMLAMADRRGRVWASVPGLANRAQVSLEDAKAALARFLAPDQYSRTPDYEGRRIEAIDGGWILLNYTKYRELRDHEERLEYQRRWDRQHRLNPTLSDKIRPRPTHAEAEADVSNPPSAGKPASTDFEAVWKALPKRAGNNPKSRALRAYRARLAEGCAHQAMLDGVSRYASFCAATGKTGSEFVMQGATFLGPEKPFTQQWTVTSAVPSWWLTQDSILAKAKELGIATRGETAETLKAQIRERLGTTI